MSQSGPLTGGGGGGGGIETINGDVGSITGSTVTIFANNATNNSGSTVEFVNSGTVSTFNVTDGAQNTIIGNGSGNLASTGAQNTAVGAFNLSSVTNGAQNTACGNDILGACTTGGGNTGIGFGVMGTLTSGNNNIGVGFEGVLAGITTGVDNIAFGQNCGQAYTSSESDNILFNNLGVVGESHIIRIGTQGSGSGQQDKAFVAGITGVTIPGSPVAVSSTGQLSDLGFGTAAQILTSNGAGVSPTWQAAGGGGASVAFMGYLAATASGVIGAGVPWTLVGLTSSFDLGPDLNAATGVFTAPLTGIYYLGCTVNVSGFGVTNTDLDVSIILSGALNLQPVNNINPFTTGNGNMGFEGGSLIHMAMGDTAHVEIDASGTNYDVFGTGSSAYTNFYGYKVA